MPMDHTGFPSDAIKLAQAIKSTMPATNLPMIPKDLLDAMDKMWPERSPSSLADTIESLMWRGGQRNVVRKLMDEYSRQQDNLLNR